MTAPLNPGDRAWCLITRSTGGRSRSGETATLEGAAQVEIVAQLEGEVYRVRCVAASPEWMNGRELELPRSRLFAKHDRVEHLAFGELYASLTEPGSIEHRRIAGLLEEVRRARGITEAEAREAKRSVGLAPAAAQTELPL